MEAFRKRLIEIDKKLEQEWAELTDEQFDLLTETFGNWQPPREKGGRYYVQLLPDEDGFLNQNRTYKSLILATKTESEGYQTQFTEEEIRAIDERYWQFAVEMEEKNV